MTRSSAALFRHLIRAYPGQSAVVVGLLFVSGLLEGFGVFTFLPLLQQTSGRSTGSSLGGVLGIMQDFGQSLDIPVLLAFIVVAISLKGAFLMLAMRTAGYASAAFARDLRIGLIHTLMEARWSYFTSKPTGNLANAIGNEARRSAMMFAQATQFIATGIQVLVYALLAVFVSWPVTVAAAAMGGAMAFFLRKLVGAARRAGESQTRHVEALVSRLTDGIKALKPLKAMGLEDRVQPLLERETEAINRAQQREIVSTAAVQAMTEPIAVIGVAGLVYILLGVVEMPVERMLFMVFLFYRVVSRTGSLQNSYQKVVALESGYWAIADATDEAAQAREHVPAGPILSLKHEVRFEHVSFDYGSERIVDRLDLVIHARTLVAIVGASGVGKTTILDLLTGLLVPTAGQVTIDDVPLQKADLRQWRLSIGYVPQDSVLFNGSILENITLTDDLPETEVEAALRAAGAWDFVRLLPSGLHTGVGEAGAQLSGGQRQRLAIARALVRAPQLLLLDEATTALDPTTERAVLDTVRELSRRVTVVAVSHQPAVLDVADHVVRLERPAQNAEPPLSD